MTATETVKRSPSRRPPAGGPVDLAGLDRAGLEAFFTELGEKRFRARQVMQWLHQRGVSDFEAMTDLGKNLRARLAEQARVLEPEVLSEQRSSDGTIKWLLGLEDGNAVETVFIPDDDRGTLCISSQAGCPLDCKFCATGYGGFKRNLATGEIIAQVRHARSVVGDRLTNIVFMGMGEPLLNYDAVLRTIHLLMDDYAFGLSRRRITVSTVGVVPKITELGQDTPVNLAISLHGVTDEVRDYIVPINRTYPLERLLQACRDYPLPPNRRITFEYVMLDGVNDSPEEARMLADRLAGIPAKVNLIPFNPFPQAEFRRSPQKTIDRFRDILLERGMVAVTRTPRGEDIDAACGQLQGQARAREQQPGGTEGP
ncbi:23S rRNA (adenine(2503)-C(2))-methyltransferase RlmN [Thiohalorhabdus methylotrophus]|uniref:Dual-specificity RNA methyltransferase RlmN n=1 Tax=Thiohalorhabdus methylotrophus TaxID=3242694 RepID=A0ABV4TUF1_9GAMM